MRTKLYCQKCGKMVQVDIMVFEEHEIVLIPECGHMHLCKVAIYVDGATQLNTEYSKSDFIKIHGTGDWIQIAVNENIICPKCHAEVQGYQYCPRCNTPFTKEVLDTVYPPKKTDKDNEKEVTSL